MAEEKKDNEALGKAKGYDKQTYVQLTTQFGLKTNITQMPCLGLGTWLSKQGEVAKAVSCALSVGYHHIDCAHVYGNEKEVGEGLKNSFTSNIISRDNVFVTSKLWNTDHHPDDVLPAIKNTLNNLGLQYLDLYLIHWPHNFARGKDPFPKHENGTINYGDLVSITDTWKAMEQCVRLGLTRHIGLSNFNHKQIDEILQACSIKPAVLQCESHPYFTQKKLIGHAKSKGIVFTSYSPLGAPKRPWAKADEPILLNDPKLKAIADKKNATVAQLLIRYQIERGNVVIPKSVTPKRIQSNMEVWHFNLTNDDMKQIESFNRNWRACLPLITLKDGTKGARDAKHPNFPFNIEY